MKNRITDSAKSNRGAFCFLMPFAGRRPFPSPCLTLAFGIWLIASACVLPAQEKENSEFKLAVGLYNDGMYDLAVEQLKNFIDAYPNSANGIEARFYLGNTQMKLKLYEEARITFQNFALAFVEHPKAPEAWIRVGDAFFLLNNAKEAASAYERVKVFHPKSQLVPEALLKAGQLYRQAGDRENAKRNFRTIISDYPDGASLLPARLALSEIYAEEGETEAAYREARRVAESSASAPVKSAALFALGKLQIMTSLFDAAETTFNLIIAGYKKTQAASSAAFELGKLRMGSGDYAGAVENFKKAGSESPAGDSLIGECLLETGRAYILLKEYDSAQKSFENFIRRFPGSSSCDRAVLDAADAAFFGGSYSTAHQYAKKILATGNSALEDRALNIAADASIKLGQYNEAARYLASFADKYQEHPQAAAVSLKLAGLYKEQQHDFRKAINIYDQIAQRYTHAPQVIDAALGAAECQEGLSDYEGALKTYSDIQSQYPANDHYKNISQKIEFLRNHKIKDRDAGIEKLARLMGEVLTEKSKGDLSFKLGKIYFHDLKDYEAACGQFGAAIDLGVDEDKFMEAYFLRARAYHLRSELNPDFAEQAVIYYDAFLKQFPDGSRSEEAAYYSYRLKSGLREGAASIALTEDFLKKRANSPYRDEILHDLGIALTLSDLLPAALQTFESLTREYPGSPLAPASYFEMGNIQSRLRRPDSAEANWQKAFSFSPKHYVAAAALWNIADLKREKKEYREAVSLWKRIADEFFYTTYAQKAASMLPEAYIAGGEFDEAIEHNLAALSAQRSGLMRWDPVHAIYFNIARAFEKKGERQKAVEYYNLYLLNDRKSASAGSAFYSLGALARAQGNMDHASAYFKQAAALGGTGNVTMEVADLLFQTGQYTEAAKQYTLLAQSTDSVNVKEYCQVRVIVAMLRMDRIAEAQKATSDFEKVFKESREYKSEFEYEKGLLYYRRQDYAAAKKLFEKVADGFKNSRQSPWAHYYLGKISEMTDKAEDAAKKYSAILKNFQDSDVIPRVLLSLGNMHFNAERYEESIRYYQQIIRSPETAGDILPYAMGNIIEAYESTKLYDEALKTLRGYLDRYPNDENIVDKKIKLGTLYIKIGYYEQAIVHFRNLIPEAGSLLEAELRYNIGESYYYKGDYQQAVLEFLKVPYLVTKQGKVNWTATALYMAGQSYEKMSKFEEAAGMYQQIIDRPGIDATFKGAARKEIDRVKSMMRKDPE